MPLYAIVPKLDFYEIKRCINVRKCSFKNIPTMPINYKVVHIGAKIMQHVLTLRKIFLIFGFALVVFGCDMNKAQSPNANKEVLAA